jgi:prepilin-type N-terminal cleavage/methylation domain-containing protein
LPKDQPEQPVKPVQYRGPEPAIRPRWAFTLIELLVVIAVISILATLLLPVLGNAKASSKRAACLQNMKQLQLGFQMYAADYVGRLVQNLDQMAPTNGTLPGVTPPPDPTTNAWVYGNMKAPADATNISEITTGLLFPYVPQPMAYRCPADQSQSAGIPRDRSYTMNAWFGSDEMETEYMEQGYRVFLKESDLAATTPASTWTTLDEHPLTLQDGWFVVTMDDSMPFARLPATRHQNGYCLNFADGHAESFHVLTSEAQIPENQSQAFALGPVGISSFNSDWLKLKQSTTAP